MNFNVPITLREDAVRFLNNYWFQIAASIFEKVVEVCELSEDQADSLRIVALKPMMFSIKEMGVDDEV
jgi:hypothetical protein